MEEVVKRNSLDPHVNMVPQEELTPRLAKKKFKTIAIAVVATARVQTFREVFQSGNLTDPGSDDEDDDVCRKDISKEKTYPPKWKKYLGMILALMSSLVFSLTALLVKKLHDYHPFSIAMWRFQGALIPVLPLILYKQCTGTEENNVFASVYPLNNRKRVKLFFLVLLRSILSCNSLLLHFYSLKYMEMGDALVIASATPIFVTLLARIFLGEKCGVVTIIASVVTLLGVGIITRPPHLTGAESFDDETLIGSGLAFGCMILASISFTVLRYIRKVHHSFTTLMFGLWGGLENLMLALAFNVLDIPQGWKEWGLIMALAILTFLGQTAIIWAMKCEQAGPVALVRTCDVLFAFVWQILILGLLPDKLSIIGASIVVLAVSVCGFRKWVASLPDDHSMKKRFKLILY